ncbi:MAG: acetoin dehydrogenase [Deltaproteobacteria bacterium CG07_land_8_20_14_0_80_38_7]|nr:MAG: acetoin dehydrogenase [Deltaproteobacteria bacterium CG07_land_8_20_14_0_80_38_7]
MTLSIDKKIAIDILRRMLLIRTTEETIAQKYPEGKMRCPTHLCTGQEAVAAVVGVVLRNDDFAISTHRAHGHYLGKGGDVNSMIAEIYGKVTGCSAGKGGSMHLIDKEVGFMGSTAIVGGTIPVGVGLGFSIQLHGGDQVSCVFLGDGAIEEGVFYESVNFAVLKKLPVLFICENNLYSVYSSLKVRQPEGRKIYKMVEGLGIKSDCGDGNNAIEVYEKLAPTIKEIRNGDGPRFFEFSTYRWREHCGPNFDNNIGYRTEAEYLEWKEKDPVKYMKSRLVDECILTNEEMHSMENDIQIKVNAAFDFAENSEFPSEEDLFTYVYAE